MKIFITSPEEKITFNIFQGALIYTRTIPYMLWYLNKKIMSIINYAVNSN